MKLLALLTIVMLPIAAHAECTTFGSTVQCDTSEEAQSLSSPDESFQQFSDRLAAQNEAATQALIERRNAEEDGYAEGRADADAERER